MQGLLPLQRYFEFHGRSGRAEFWQFAGLFAIAIVIGYVLDTVFRQVDTPVFTLLVVALGLCPFYAVATRRLHDRDISGKWLAGHAALVVLASALVNSAGYYAYSETASSHYWLARASQFAVRALVGAFFYVSLKKGEEGNNRYGPPVSSSQPAPTFADLVAKAKSQFSGTKPAASPGQPAGDPDPLEQIERLARLKDAGALTEEEFQQQKAACLARLS